MKSPSGFRTPHIKLVPIREAFRQCLLFGVLMLMASPLLASCSAWRFQAAHQDGGALIFIGEQIAENIVFHGSKPKTNQTFRVIEMLSGDSRETIDVVHNWTRGRVSDFMPKVEKPIFVVNDWWAGHHFYKRRRCSFPNNEQVIQLFKLIEEGSITVEEANTRYFVARRDSTIFELERELIKSLIKNETSSPLTNPLLDDFIKVSWVSLDYSQGYSQEALKERLSSKLERLNVSDEQRINLNLLLARQIKGVDALNKVRGQEEGSIEQWNQLFGRSFEAYRESFRRTAAEVWFLEYLRQKTDPIVLAANKMRNKPSLAARYLLDTTLMSDASFRRRVFKSLVKVNPDLSLEHLLKLSPAEEKYQILKAYLLKELKIYQLPQLGIFEKTLSEYEALANSPGFPAKNKLRPSKQPDQI